MVSIHVPTRGTTQAVMMMSKYTTVSIHVEGVKFSVSMGKILL